MDPVETYRNALRRVLLTWEERPGPGSTLRFEAVFDRERDRYLVVVVGVDVTAAEVLPVLPVRRTLERALTVGASPREIAREPAAEFRDAARPGGIVGQVNQQPQEAVSLVENATVRGIAVSARHVEPLVEHSQDVPHAALRRDGGGEFRRWWMVRREVRRP